VTREAVAWVFNLDAEDELARGGPHTPTKEIRERVERLLPTLRQLMHPLDSVLWPEGPARAASRAGRAWCPTKWALEQVRRAGLEVPEAPDVEVLRAVNHRRFAHRLGQALPGAQFVETEAALLEVLSDSSALETVSSERNWLMKRPLGYAGRGRRKIAGPQLRASDRTWVEAALRSGDGLQVEPLVERTLDAGLHGWLARDGALTLGEPTVQVVDATGTWVSSERAGPSTLSLIEREALVGEARVTASALHHAGYFGPFGLDAFRWRAPDGTAHFQPRCELNARYSMGWAVGMGPLAP